MSSKQEADGGNGEQKKERQVSRAESYAFIQRRIHTSKSSRNIHANRQGANSPERQSGNEGRISQRRVAVDVRKTLTYEQLSSSLTVSGGILMGESSRSNELSGTDGVCLTHSSSRSIRVEQEERKKKKKKKESKSSKSSRPGKKKDVDKIDIDHKPEKAKKKKKKKKKKTGEESSESLSDGSGISGRIRSGSCRPTARRFSVHNVEKSEKPQTREDSLSAILERRNRSITNSIALKISEGGEQEQTGTNDIKEMLRLRREARNRGTSPDTKGENGTEIRTSSGSMIVMPSRSRMAEIEQMKSRFGPSGTPQKGPLTGQAVQGSPHTFRSFMHLNKGDGGKERLGFDSRSSSSSLTEEDMRRASIEVNVQRASDLEERIGDVEHKGQSSSRSLDDEYVKTGFKGNLSGGSSSDGMRNRSPSSENDSKNRKFSGSPRRSLTLGSNEDNIEMLRSSMQKRSRYRVSKILEGVSESDSGSDLGKGSPRTLKGSRMKTGRYHSDPEFEGEVSESSSESDGTFRKSYHSPGVDKERYQGLQKVGNISIPMLDLDVGIDGEAPKKGRRRRLSTKEEDLISTVDLLKVLFSEDMPFIVTLTEVVDVKDFEPVARALVILAERRTGGLLLMEWAIRHELGLHAQQLHTTGATLFRQDGYATLLLSQYAHYVSGTYLLHTLQPPMSRFFSKRKRKDSYETDPLRVTRNGGNLKANIRRLMQLTDALLAAISVSLQVAPMQLRVLCFMLREEAQQVVGSEGTDTQHTHSVVLGGFLFLRFFCPAIVSPTSFGLIPERKLCQSAQRGMILAAKVIQAMANGIEFEEGSPLEPMNAYMVDKKEVMAGFLSAFPVAPNPTDMPEPIQPAEALVKSAVITLKEVVLEHKSTFLVYGL